ncbi:hypothetical protein [Paludisphaera soli]|uniref:hypothetical protein n=1 Tax=Paludisphaera soli TaxID=2712865 RepID=UPI0013EA96D8|nr:hypothetical protein [Paludisphaera soli]
MARIGWGRAGVFARGGGDRARRRRLAPACETLEGRRLLAVSLAFDYSLDGGFFTAGRRTLLESTLNAMAARLGDSLAAVPSAGYTLPTNSGNRTVQTGVAADTLKVYAYGISLSGSTAAQGGAFYSLPPNNAMRGQGANDFAPDVTYLMFDDDGGTNWFFGTTTAGLTWDQVDFVTVARHEFLHSLGFLGSQPTFDRFVQNGVFNGPAVRAANGGAGVPMNGSHIAPSVPSIMNAVTMAGQRSDLTALDWAFLQDFGWSVSTVTPPPPPPAASFVRDFALFTGGQGDGQARVRVDPSRGVHLMALDVLAGDTLRIRTLDGSTAAEIGVDSVVKLFDAAGGVIVDDDDSSAQAGKEDFTHTFATGGRYWVGASTYEQRNYTFTAPSTVVEPATAFHLEATLTGRVGDEPHNLAGASSPVAFSGGTFAVATTMAGEAADYFRIDAVAGAGYAIATALPAGGGLAGATVVSVYDAAGRRVAAMSGGSAYDAVSFTASATGPYYLRVARVVGPAAVDPNESIAEPGFSVALPGVGYSIQGTRGRGHDYALSIVETAPVPPPNLHPLFLDFGPYGLWRWSEAEGVRQINAADPQDFAVAADGSLFVDFGPYGLWSWSEAAGMRQINGADPQAIAPGPDGELYVDYGRFGLWRWTAAEGLRQINAADPENFAAGASGELYVDYGPYGLWRWTAAAGLRILNAANPEGFAPGAYGTLYIDFGPSGLWLWTEAGGFHRMNAANPEGLAAGPGGTLSIDFGPGGLWAWSGGAFELINPANPEGLAASADGWLYVDFGPFGVWRRAAVGGFQRLNPADPQRLAVLSAFGRA